MKNPHTALIDTLSSGLAPVRRPSPIDRVATAWLLAAALSVAGIMLLVAPWRSGAFAQLLAEPRFLLEILLGVAAIVVLGFGGFRAAVPGALGPGLTAAGIVLLCVWVGGYVFGLISPALEPSMAGKRPFCVFESLLYGLPGVLTALVLVRRRYPLQPLRCAVLLGLAAGMMPALFMQLACMYEPAHILAFHVLPGLLPAAVGVLLARRW